MKYVTEAAHGPPQHLDRRRSVRRVPHAAPDALLTGIGWGLLFSLVGFWLPLALLVSRGVEAT